MLDGRKIENDLRTSMPYGVLGEITKVFGFKSQSYVGRVLIGEAKSPKVLECAKRIKKAYESCGFEEKKQEIYAEYRTN